MNRSVFGALLVLASLVLAEGVIRRRRSNTGYCNNRRRGYKMKPTPKQMATGPFCTGVCPCCSAAAMAKTVDLDALEAPKKLRESHSDSVKEAKPAAMLSRWAQDGNPLTRVTTKADGSHVEATRLYDVSDDDFHKTLLKNCVQKYSLQEFYEEKMDDYPSWEQVEGLKASRGWTDPELAMWMYTTEMPNVYRPMNLMLRKATSMDDIDEYWQSYFLILKDGLVNYAEFVDTKTWRGVSDCSSLEVLHQGDEGVLPSFTSTSTNENVAKGFSGGCTVLQLTGGGFDISKYSNFPGEAELLVEEGRVYTIDAVDDSGPYTMFDLNAPEKLLLPQNEEPAAEEPKLDCSKVHEATSCPICKCCNKQFQPADVELEDEEDDAFVIADAAQAQASMGRAYFAIASAALFAGSAVALAAVVPKFRARLAGREQADSYEPLVDGQ